jgi:hypothetical protein
MGSNLSLDRQKQIDNRYTRTEIFAAVLFNSLNLITMAYAGYKQIKSPQRHLVILCLCFGTAALAGAIYDA